MRSLAPTALLLASIAFAGCAVQVDNPTSDDDTSDESAAALSAYGEKLVGAYKIASGTGDFTWLVLQGDGHYFTETQIFCVRAPCINPRENGKFIGYKPKAGSSVGGLRLVPKKGDTRHYQVKLGKGALQLSSDKGATWAKYESVGTFCDEAADCEGQSYAHIMCVGHATCTSERTCGYSCGIKCDYTSDPSKRYVGKSADECSRIKFACETGTEYFSDGCGCGCVAVKPKPCVVSGCSGQICGETSMITTCEWRAEYACYQKLGVCERDSSGACGWKKTTELAACLAK